MITAVKKKTISNYTRHIFNISGISDHVIRTQQTIFKSSVNSFLSFHYSLNDLSKPEQLFSKLLSIALKIHERLYDTMYIYLIYILFTALKIHRICTAVTLSVRESSFFFYPSFPCLPCIAGIYSQTNNYDER